MRTGREAVGPRFAGLCHQAALKSFESLAFWEPKTE